MSGDIMPKFEYWMVFLPEIHSSSFLLYVFNRAEGSNKLRDYSSGQATEKGQPGIAAVFSRTRETTTRFKYDEHKVTDNEYG
jgi:hypothetical protein